jgi:aromatase
MKIENNIFIKAGYDPVFEVTNDIERWPEFFDEYSGSEILERVGNKITFKLTNKEGKSWISWRVLEKENNRCHAERMDPLFPFKFMNLEWVYELIDGGVNMIWKQEFEMDEKSSYTDEQARDNMNRHSRENMKRIKEYIEKNHA